MSDNELISAYIKTIKTPGHNTKKLFTIGMVALNGTGKSYFANTLADCLNLYVASNDRIRRWLNEQGFEGESPQQELMQKIAEASSIYLYKQHVSHIIDADLIKFHNVARQNAIANKAEFFLLHLTAPEDIVLERLAKREKDIASGQSDSLSRVGADEYFRRKELHNETGIPDGLLLTINTNNDIVEEVERTVGLLKKHDVI